MTDPDLAKLPLILVADDDVLLPLIIEPLLSKAQYRIQFAATGEECLRMVGEEFPDLILLDAVMPAPDGFECCRQIRSLPQGSEVPILMITYLEDEYSVEQAFEAGATDFIPKPINWAVLKQRIRRLLQAHRDRQAILNLNAELDYQVKVRNAELKRAIDFEQLLRVITDEVRGSLNEQDILSTATQELTSGLGLGLCKVGMPNPDGITYSIPCEYTGYFSSLITPEDLQLNLEILPQLKQGKTVLYSRRDSSLGRVTILTCPLGSGDDFLGFLSLMRYIHLEFIPAEIRLAEQVANQCLIGIRQSRLYQTAQSQVTALESLNQLKDDFVSLVSHELRSPMTSLRMALRMMAIAPNEAKRQTYYGMAVSECERQIDMINDLLDLQRLAAQKYDLTPEKLSLETWILEILPPVEASAQAKNQALKIHWLATDLQVETDSQSLHRILRELLHNAVKYTPPAGEIHLEIDSSPEAIEFKVKNTNEIPQSQLDRIFERFYRIPQSDHWKHGGTGLGLSLVKELAAQLQASLQVSSANGWTEFCLRIPIHCPAKKETVQLLQYA